MKKIIIMMLCIALGNQSVFLQTSKQKQPTKVIAIIKQSRSEIVNCNFIFDNKEIKKIELLEQSNIIKEYPNFKGAVVVRLTPIKNTIILNSHEIMDHFKLKNKKYIFLLDDELQVDTIPLYSTKSFIQSCTIREIGDTINIISKNYEIKKVNKEKRERQRALDKYFFSQKGRN